MLSLWTVFIDSSIISKLSRQLTTAYHLCIENTIDNESPFQVIFSPVLVQLWCKYRRNNGLYRLGGQFEPLFA